MFSIFNKSVHFPAATFLKVDMHSHILPGIDDGSPDVATSIQLIDGMIAMGYKALIATPHTMNDLYPNTPETIHNAYIQLLTTLKARNYSIPIGYASEYLIDEGFEQKINQGLLCFSETEKYVLIETMFTALPPSLEDILFQLSTHGYKPILAHPERYLYLDDKMKQLDVFQKHHCCFQSNILSFAGYYGQREKEFAHQLLDAGKIDFLGTDLHHLRHLKVLKQLQVNSKIADKLAAIAYKNATLLSGMGISNPA